MKLIIAIIAFACALPAQDPAAQVRFKATTGDVVLSGAGTVATLQVKPVNNVQIFIDQIVVYCSVACNVTQAANGTAATATLGTVAPLLPNKLTDALPVSFYTASNVGSGTDQGGVVHIPAGATVILCLATSCGQSKDITLGPSPGGPGVGANYSVTVSSITGTANITYFGRIGS